MSEFLHFDPINLVVVIVGIVAAWVTLRNDSKWHSTWIHEHSKECDEQRKANNKILTELQTVNAQFATMAQAHDHRIDRIEQHLDRGKGVTAQ